MAVRSVNPFKCRMWDMHDRLGENIDLGSCASLIQSIRKHGQKHPVLGRPSSGKDEFEYELIYGARRLFAAQQLGIDLLVDVRELDDRAALIHMDIENRVRADISPYERGRSYRRWLSAGYFRNQAELAKALALSGARVSRLLRYADLPAIVVEAFRSPNDIREEWAIALAKLCADPASRAEVMERARGFGRSARTASPQAVFDYLTSGRRSESLPSSRPRDDIVKDPSGRPLFRVRYREKAVYLILPRESITLPLLRQINEHIRETLSADCRSSKDEAASGSKLSSGEVACGHARTLARR